MTLATLSEVLRPAQKGGYAIAGLVTLGWEDMRAFVTAAESEDTPVILQAGPGCRAHTPLPVLAAMLRHLAQGARVPVVVHLDHGNSYEECAQAIDLGFTSVMYDGSRLPLRENIDRTAAVAALAHAAGVSCEGEIGFVGYNAGAASTGTDPAEAAVFAAQTAVDAMAVSVGNVHLQTNTQTKIDTDRLSTIAALCPNVPLVIHGGSGVSLDQRRLLAAAGLVSKFNIGTELRQTFGRTLRAAMTAEPEAFDRIAILSQTEGPMATAAQTILRNLRPDRDERL
ncbi:MAG: class II fructose-bisphosphate aldolase [Rhodobacteraceae bacterium]|nr:class II fructose-bisphosphate aldolase [Paracoccaceae bacterium]MCF8513947.1 class II fructose-bisphosphate aldolase [Paracoccaceae bacterium]MCF8518191.1 class II fructose-bisphosphate aldolase [Paracoccaceae bacterium]